MATLTPETDIATALETALSLTSAQVKCGPPRSPVEPGADTVSIWVNPYSDDAAPFLNAAVEGSYWRTRVQVLVKSAPDDFAGGITTARAARDALHTKQPSGYVAWTLTPGFGGPNYIGPDESGQHQFVVNITAEWTAAN